MQAKVEFGNRDVDWSACRVPLGVTSLDQVHGTTTVVVTRPGGQCGASADAAVTNVVGARLLIRTADCAPVALVAKRSGEVVAVGAVHVGWKGLRDGVIGSSVAAIRAFNVDSIDARLGPCIGAACYEFGVDDLADVARSVGPTVCATTANDRSALNVVAGVAAQCRLLGVGFDLSAWHCTACHDLRSFSYRARGDSGRQGLLVSLEPSPS
jgi:polyphenol oxidase